MRLRPRRLVRPRHRSRRPTRRRGRGDTLLALRSRRYRAVWLALTVSMVGFWLQATARAYLVYEATGSAAALGAVYLASYGPQLLVSPWAGIAADRWDRRRIVLTGTVGMQLVALATAVLVWTDRAAVAPVLLLSLVGGVLLTLQGTASQALLPDLVRREALTSAVSLQAMSVSGTRVVGPMLAGALLPLVGASWLFVLQAVTLLPAVVVHWRTPLPQRPAPDLADRGLAALTAGLRYAARRPELRVPLGLIAVLSAVGMVFQPLGLAYATEVLSRGDAELGVARFGLLQGAVGAGALLGVLVVASLRHRPAAALLGSGALMSSALVALGLTSALPLALAVSAVLGAAQLATTNVAQVLAQHHAPVRLRGRVLALTQVATTGLFPFTSYGLAHLADAVGTPRTYVACGALCLAAVALTVPVRRHVRLPSATESQALHAVPDLPEQAAPVAGRASSPVPG